MLLKSTAIHLPFLSRYFCKRLPSSWHAPPICIMIRLPFVSRYFCRSIRVRGRWNTPRNGLSRAARWVMEWWWMESPNFRPWNWLSGPDISSKKSLVLLVRRRIPQKFQALKLQNSGPEIWQIHPPAFHTPPFACLVYAGMSCVRAHFVYESLRHPSPEKSSRP